MVVTSIASFLLLWEAGYQPRHRSKREIGIGRLARRRKEDPLSTRVSEPAERGWPTQTPWMPSPPAATRWLPSPPAATCWLPSPSTQTSWMPSPPAEPELPDRFENDRLRDVLEGFPLDELTRLIPEIVHSVVLSSANTVMTAWNDFREDWNNLQEDAVVIRLGRAHEAWWLITNGPLHQAMGGR